MNYECILYTVRIPYTYVDIGQTETLDQSRASNWQSRLQGRIQGRQPSIGLISMYSKHAVLAQVPILGLKVLRSQTPNSKTCNLPV